MRISSWLLTAALIARAAAAQSGDNPPPFPAPGRLVDVGGWRLHLNCTGQVTAGQPTVILEAGIGDFSVEWGLVQPSVSAFARVCSYDRAGDGWSDLGPDPRTFHQTVYELHTLIDNASVQRPLLLVGHSYGGWLVRLYQAEYPSEVGGIVLVEAGEDDPLRLTSTGTVVRSSTLVTGRPIPPVRMRGPLRESDVPPGAMTQIRSAVQQAAETANEPPRDKLPAEARAMRSWALQRWQHAAAANNPFELEELADLRNRYAGKQFPLGDLPLIVITRGLPDDTTADGQTREAEHRANHLAVSHFSRVGKLIVAERSGHHIQIEQPDLVANAIRDILAQIGRR
ncbi:MAG TPA: alpha/beta hydrolase [Gemmatimonadaceae bacterium]|nr:alpha/beta hydrolase [Gemmatimonadaceae bacterium]